MKCMKARESGIVNKKLYSIFFEIIKLSPVKFFTEYFFTASEALFMGLTVLQLQKVFDSVINTAEIKKILYNLIFLLIYTVMSEISGGISTYLGEYYSLISIKYLLKNIDLKIASLPPIYFKNPKNLNTIESAVYGAKSVRSVLNVFMDIFSLYIPYYLFISFYLWSLNPFFVFGMFFIFFPVIISQFYKKKYFEKLEHFHSPLRREKNIYSSYIKDKKCLKEIRLFGAEKYFIKLFREASFNYHKLNSQYRRKVNKTEAIADILTISGYIGILVSSIILISDGKLSVGAFAAVYTSFSELFGLTEEIFEYRIGEVSEVYGKIKIYTEFMNTEYGKDGEKIIERINKIELKNVSFSYPEGKTALSNINLTLQKGDKIAVVGKNGSGKTTLSKILLGLYRPENGEVFYNGISQSKILTESFKEKETAIFQNFCRYKISLEDNVCISNTKEEKNYNRIKNSLIYAGFENTDGLKTILSKEFGGTDFSGGQWQRTAIARGVYRNYDFIVLDEPTAAIDPIAENDMYERFSELGNDGIFFVVTHRLASVKYCNKIILMEKGKILCSGSHEELLKKSEKYYEMWTSQASMYI